MPSLHLLLPVLLSLLLAWPPCTGANEDYLLPFTEHLDPDGDVTLRWGFSEIQGTITFELAFRTTAWVGFGFSPNGGMKGADIVIGGVTPDGTSYFTDRHATGNRLPLVDDEQSYTLLSLTEVDGHTNMTFKRSIQTCDEDDFPITDGPIKLIYAYGMTDEIKYHDRRGTKEVNLLKYMPRASLPDSDFMDFTVQNFTVPAKHTHYQCSIIAVPKLNGTHHIYRIEPVIEHLDLVHHMLIYSCSSSVTQPDEWTCFESTKGRHCLSVMSAWGVGGGAFELPENAGIPIGGEDDATFYRLEIHYNNVKLEAGCKDNSGMRLHYTAQLRQHNVGIMTTGMMVAPRWGYAIPPNASAFHSYGMCNTSHFPELLVDPMPDLQVFAVGLHTHLAGRKVRAGLFRGGEEIDMLGLDESYNFELQQFNNLGNIKTVKLGDELMVECTYNTANRTGSTKFGFATTDEMCFAFIFYYPAINISSCSSHPNMHYLAAILGKEDKQLVQEIMTQSWDEEAIVLHEATMKDIPQIEIIIDKYGNISLHYEGMVRNMKATPSVACKSNLVTSSPNTSQVPNPMGPIGSSSRVVTSAASVLLLLLQAVL